MAQNRTFRTFGIVRSDRKFNFVPFSPAQMNLGSESSKTCQSVVPLQEAMGLAAQTLESCSRHFVPQHAM